MTELELAVRLAVAGLAGLAVGLEREWSGHATGPDARFAGIRTFFLLGALGGIAGWLATGPSPPLAVVLLAGAAALVVAAYVMAARRGRDGIDGTTEAAALLVLAVGAIAGRGQLQVASAMAAVMVLALGEKDTIRRFVERIDAVEMRAALQFAVLALVVLPLLPPGPYGPYGAIRPRLMWTVVLLFSAVSFAGYLARKALGPARGYVVTGALGGLISSTAVTLAFARLSRRYPEAARALALGTVAACTVLVPRVATVVAVLNPAFLPNVAVLLAPMLVVGVAIWLIGRRPDDATPPADLTTRNPLELGHALKMTVGFQVIVFAVELARARFGDIGVVASAFGAGLTDVDALTLSMVRIATDAAAWDLAARGLVVGIVANTLLKTVVAGWIGGPGYRRVVIPGMLALLATGAAAWALAPR